jgi:ATP synthase protein I
MSSNGNRAAPRTPADDGPHGPHGLGVGWSVFSYLIAGMVAYGGIGWLVGRAVHVAALFPVGMLVGLGISLSYIIYRYGRQGAAEEGRGNR